MCLQHGNELLLSNKKNLFYKKGAFSCDLRCVQMGFQEELQQTNDGADRYGIPGRTKA